MFNYWMAVASREHVLRGVSESFMQVCHGKLTPLKWMKAGEWIIYYSPTEIFGDKMPCRHFTAIGQIHPREPYLFKMSETFVPWRRDVQFYTARDTPIVPLIDQLSFIVDKKRWGFPFRRGCFMIPKSDFLLIAEHMGLAID